MATQATCPEYKSWKGDVGNLHWADLVVIIVYFAGVIAVGIWSSFKNRGSVEGTVIQETLIIGQKYSTDP